MSDSFKTLEGVKLRYRDSGTVGPAIFFTHGIGSSLETWQQLEQALSQQFRVITWDLPGHGLSDLGKQPYSSEDFAHLAWTLLDSLEVDRVVLVGNSLGAAISIRMQALQTRRVMHTILLNAATIGLEAPLVFRLMILPGLGELLTKPSEMNVSNQIKAIFHDQGCVTDDIRSLVKRNVYKEGGAFAFRNTLKGFTTFFGQRKEEVNRSLRELSQVICPVYFVHGRHDSVIPLEHTLQAHAKTPGSSLMVLENCGHTPQIECPDKITGLLKRILL